MRCHGGKALLGCHGWIPWWCAIRGCHGGALLLGAKRETGQKNARKSGKNHRKVLQIHSVRVKYMFEVDVNGLMS